MGAVQDGGEGVKLIDKDAILAAIDKERQILIEQERFGAEHIVVHHARRLVEDATIIDAIPIELTAQHLGRSFHSEPEKWADWLRMIRDDIPEKQEGDDEAD